MRSFRLGLSLKDLGRWSGGSVIAPFMIINCSQTLRIPLDERYSPKLFWITINLLLITKCYKIIFFPNSHPELKDLFKISIHDRRTRSHNFQITPFQSFHNRELYHSFACRVPRIWNKLPCDIFSSLNSFKSSIYELDLVALSNLT